MSKLGWKEINADPRCMAARALYATLADSRGLGEGHARYNIQYVLCRSVLTPEESGYDPEAHARLVQDAVRTYIRPQFREAWLAELERIRASVAAQYPQGNASG